MVSLDKSRDAMGEVGNDSCLACTGSIELRLCKIRNEEEREGRQLKINVRKRINSTTREVTN